MEDPLISHFQLILRVNGSRCEMVSTCHDGGKSIRHFSAVGCGQSWSTFCHPRCILLGTGNLFRTKNDWFYALLDGLVFV